MYKWFTSTLIGQRHCADEVSVFVQFTHSARCVRSMLRMVVSFTTMRFSIVCQRPKHIQYTSTYMLRNDTSVIVSLSLSLSLHLSLFRTWQFTKFSVLFRLPCLWQYCLLTHFNGTGNKESKSYEWKPRITHSFICVQCVHTFFSSMSLFPCVWHNSSRTPNSHLCTNILSEYRKHLENWLFYPGRLWRLACEVH